MTRAPAIALAPVVIPPLQEAVEGAGGRLTDPDEADAVVWINPADPDGLAAALASSPARWVQLPFAGIESFFQAGVIDGARVWTCTKGIYGEATAEHGLALLLACARRLAAHARAKGWAADFASFGRPEQRLRGTTVLIVGTGGIGRALARMLEPLGPEIIAVNRSGDVMQGAGLTVPSSRLLQVVPQADFIVIAAPLTDETRGMFSAEVFTAMKNSAWLVNVARGGLVDTDALVKALESKEIAGAALDVVEPEPLPDEHPLWSFDNVVITPHVANTADMAIPELKEMVRRNVEHFAKGERLEGLVDVTLGY